MQKSLIDFSTRLFILVGVQGFEPWTPWSQTRCATGLRYTPKTAYLIQIGKFKLGEYFVKLKRIAETVEFRRSLEFGRSTRIRTLDPLVPNQVRYRAALHSEKRDNTTCSQTCQPPWIDFGLYYYRLTNFVRYGTFVLRL